MKTAGTKLDNNVFEKFIDRCNDSGQTVSEKIRELIQRECNDENYESDIPEGTIILEEPESDLSLESGKVYTKDGTWLGTLKGFAHKPIPGIIITDVE